MGHHHHHHHHHYYHHHHRHGHSNSHGAFDAGRAFAYATALNVIYVIVEAAFGFYTGSLLLIADAGHNFSDVLALLLAWGANLLAQRRPTARRTYGARRATILVSVFSSLLLVLAMGAIAWEASIRLVHPVVVDARTVVIVAGIGAVINAVSALMFVAGKGRDLNVRAAYLHMAADAAVSVGVVLAAAAILVTGWLWLDPVISLVITVVILFGTWSLLRDSINLAMDAVPSHIDAGDVVEYLGGVPGVASVHDLHIWALSTTETALTAHLVDTEGRIDDCKLCEIVTVLRNRYEIGHATLQIWRDESICANAPRCHEES
ncbi:MAG: cation diffusion facilitator family transporter [Gammaproteobacteria bacterium]|nr:cation diffusion facilitator family transporter [Gammaproteobacteria bacterium]